MNELKARRAYFSEDEYDRGAHKICAKVSDCGYDRKNDWWSYAFEDEVYLKSEADKVIARLKYKRCLAMARLCRLRARWFGDNAFYKKEQWALKWHKRWLELAEKFKLNK